MRPSVSKYAGIGLQFAAAILLFLYGGQWLDRRFGTSPLFLMLGVFVGAGAAFYSMYQGLMADQKAEKHDAAMQSAVTPDPATHSAKPPHSATQNLTTFKADEEETGQ